MPRIHTYFLPSLIPSGSLHNGQSVVIDVLRATTTIAAALAAGAEELAPFETVEQVREQARREAGPNAPLLGGERGGRKIDGFDLGNSPGEYDRERVAGRRILFTTTNGTRALLACREAAAVWIGAFVNLQAVVAGVADCADLALVCAGTDGEITREDVLFAGAVIERLSEAGRVDALNDQSRLAVSAWKPIRDGALSLVQALADSRGGRNLCEIGQAADLERAADCDSLDVLPLFRDGRIRRGL